MAERIKNMREVLILAGIDEINANGMTGFSVRRIAEACGVSCAAPYKHFHDKREFIAAIIEYVNLQWQERQSRVLAVCGPDLREQLVRICVDYVRFLMEKPFYRSILMVKDPEFDQLYHSVRGKISDRSQELVDQYFAESTLDAQTLRRKTQLIRSLIFGTIFLLDSGELEYGETALENLRFSIDREFDLP